jgi:hypothetical protein
MSEAELFDLERDVEHARARFVSNLSRLCSPSALAATKDKVRKEAYRAKDELIEKAKRSAKDRAQEILATLKQRVAANPAAALAIGAGLAWHVVHRPPIASLLVGIGVVSLFRTSPIQGGSHATTAGGVKGVLLDWSTEASEAARQSAAGLAKGAASAASRASDAAREAVATLSEQSTELVKRTSAVLHDALPEREVRDNLLLGAAAMAVAAAMGIAFQRRTQHAAITTRTRLDGDL